MPHRASEIHRVSIQRATKRYGRAFALRDVSLELRRGEPCVLMGENGAGKSTLLEVVAQLRRLDAGHVLYHGSDGPLTETEVRGQLGMVTASPLVYEALSALENVLLFARLSGLARPRHAARQMVTAMGLDPDDPKPAAHFSKGMRARLGAARALVSRPRLLLLDEATSGLDRAGRQALVSRILALAGASVILMVTHHADVAAQVAHRLVLLERGRVRQDVLLSGDTPETRGQQLAAVLKDPGSVPFSSRHTADERFGSLGNVLPPAALSGVACPPRDPEVP